MLTSPPGDPGQDTVATALRPLGGPGTAIPPALTTFIGRQKLLEELRATLLRDDVRLLTLTGPGGVGKTRIAIELARSVEGFPDGVWFISLAAVSDIDLVTRTIARALDIDVLPGVETTDTLSDTLASRNGLLVLDNFEQVVDAASLVADLLNACPALKVLVTCRTTLRLSGEIVAPVPSLPITSPEPGSIADAETDAVRLFIERARQAQPRFAPDSRDIAAIRDICERLSGLPLAIELAAARTGVLAPPELRDRLGRGMAVLAGGPRDAPERHRTMHTAIAWSSGLLPPSAQRLFRRLAVFEGGATLDAIETIADVPPVDRDPMLAVDQLATLIDHNLVVRSSDATPGSLEPRFAMLSVIREFAQEQLSISGEEDAIRDAHAGICLTIATEGESHLVHEVDPVWVDRLETEHPNIRAALAWALREGADPDLAAIGVELAASLWLFWYYHSHLIEGRAWLERALAAPVEDAIPARARALVGLGTILHFLGDQEQAREVLLQGLRRMRDAGNASGMAYALTGLGNVAEDIGRYDDAARAFTEANALFASLDDRVNVGVTLYHLGVVAVGQDDLSRATRHLDEALAMGREMGDPWSTAASLSYLGLVRGMQGDDSGANEALTEALALYLQIGTIERIVEVLRRVAVLVATQRDPSPALRLFTAADIHGSRIGIGQALPERAIYDRAMASARNRLSPAQRRTEETAGAALSLPKAIAEAERLLGATVRPKGLDATMPPGTQPLSQRELEVLRLMADGRSDAEIAGLLFISHRTVTTHTGHIYTKLDVRSRAAAVAVAIRLGLV